ncbi:hypothetical protein TEMA_11580 [Terrisporobacter mayombei]|uniref:Uncharacterized protein n=1 Tax=Terrisporobacter mayombei TaxID=1541 RepID=A0ABY9PZS0_9FIRM|nr:hypothetical protein TEMA_11580 [Terrisporobacter mayombei]
MELIIFLILSTFFFGTRIKKSENKTEYYNNILMTTLNAILLFCKITYNRSNVVKIILILLIILIIFNYIHSKLKKYKQ